MRRIHIQTKIRRAFLVLAGLLLTTPAISAGVVVNDQAQYRDAVRNAQPGDTIVLANGEWRDFEILLRAQGTAEAPITLTAEEKGKVFITGRSNLRLAGQHLVVSGLVFRDGYTPTSEVISFRSNAEDLAYHSRVTEVVIDHFNNPERSETDSWVMMYGRYNRFDHSHLIGKSNRGVTLAVRLNTEDSRRNHHRIDHNYFGPRPVLGSNGGETLRIGTSHYSLTDSITTVEHNWFERCDGEVEIISSKSGRNVFRNNVFYESRGTLTLRHGNDNLVEGNVFLGNGVDHTGGIRVINKRQVVRNNYLAGLRGYRFGSALTVMNGVPDSPINRYHQVDGAVIEHNSVIDSDHVHLAAGSDEERSAVPVNTVFRNNLVYHRGGNEVFSVFDDISGIQFEGNVANRVDDPVIESGFERAELELEQADNGLLYPAGNAFRGVGADRDLKLTPRSDTGVSWYPKPAGGNGFGQGKVHRIEPGEGVLDQAIAAAEYGDIIELGPGAYLAGKTHRIQVPLTIRSAGDVEPGKRPRVEFVRSSLFEIVEGGSLRLSGLHLSGARAPDSTGNTLIRTSRYSMLGNYTLELLDCEVTDLDVNHSFNFFTAAKSTFADLIQISGSRFSNVTGDILSLGKESDDLGLYNAEYVTISDSEFDNVGRALAVLYRGGTDESTFGPHVTVTSSRLSNVGSSSRNKTGASISLLGAQVVDIEGNTIENSSPIIITQTVGEPKTRVTGNFFSGTLAPIVTGGPAVVEANEFGLANAPLTGAQATNPTLLISPQEVAAIRASSAWPAEFARSVEEAAARVRAHLDSLPDVPLPRDAGGGYTHEQHKRNQLTIYQAGLLYQLTGNEEYAALARDMLLKYADMYPGLGAHPEKKEQSPGRLFWQSLNEAVWLVFSIQGYDAIYAWLDAGERKAIEMGLFEPMVSFLSVESPQTFDRIHNHGTWAVAAVGMAGYVMGRDRWVEQALLGLKRDGSAGFLRQLDMLFSPDGYYNEGPYYQRYALMPFVLFAEAIERNDPERGIYAHRDGIVLKAIKTTVHLSYAGLFIPINDAIKDKGLDTGELMFALAVGYARSGDPSLLSVAGLQDRVMLNGDGFRLAAARDAGLAKPFPFGSRAFSDGPNGTRGALQILRSDAAPGHQAAVLKATAQGLGHGHFDRLAWLFFDNGQEIVSDYGAARFLNVESKNGGHYLKENNTWAKQTVAHNTLVVDQTSQFGGDWKKAELIDTEPLYFDVSKGIQVAAARMDGAYEGVAFRRALIMLEGEPFQHAVVLDVLRASSEANHDYDLPLYYQGQVTDISHELDARVSGMTALGVDHGYQHLWLRAQADVADGDPFQLTWLNRGRFYTLTSLADGDIEALFTEIGAADPEFNLRREPGLVLRAKDRGEHAYVSLLEPHGEYNGSKEYTTRSRSMVSDLERFSDGSVDVIRIATRDGKETLVALSYDPDPDARHQLSVAGKILEWNGFFHRFEN